MYRYITGEGSILRFFGLTVILTALYLLMNIVCGGSSGMQLNQELPLLPKSEMTAVVNSFAVDHGALLL